MTATPQRILVTGGSGLIGLEVTRQLVALGHQVRLLDLPEQLRRARHAIAPGVETIPGSVVDPACLQAALNRCDIVIHLAALLGVQRSETQRLRCIEVNIDGTQNVLRAAVANRVRKITFASSSEVYGEPLQNPVTENAMLQGKTVYAITKLAGEELCRAYSEAFGIQYSVLRYFNCYGPYQTAQFVISRFIKNVMDGKPPVVYGDGKQVRTYTYVDDTARATIAAALGDAGNGQALNIGSGAQPINLVDLAHLVIKIGGKSGVLAPEFRADFKQTDRTKDREIFERFCDPAKARTVLGWEAKTRLEDGIARVFAAGTIFDGWVDG